MEKEIPPLETPFEFEDELSCSKEIFYTNPPNQYHPDPEAIQFHKKRVRNLMCIMNEEWIETEIPSRVIRLDFFSCTISCHIKETPIKAFYNPLLERGSFAGY